MLAKLKRIDWSVALILLLFMGISAAMIYSGAAHKGVESIYHNYHLKMLVFYGIGFLVFGLFTFFEYRLLVKISPILYGIGVILLVTVYMVAEKRLGARSSFDIPGGLSFQPAELAKITLVLAIAAYMARRKGEPLRLGLDAVPIGVLTLIYFGLVVIQPDLGNAVIYVIILAAMFWIGNIKYVHVLIGAAVVAGVIALSLYLYQANHDALEVYLKDKGFSHWMGRIDTFLDPTAVDEDKKWQLNNSKRAIGSGSLLGEGFMNGDSVQKGFISLPHSDSIFVVIGEEFGFVGSSIVLLLYFLLIYRLILIAMNSQELSGAYIIIGIIAMFVFQVFENVGMLMGLMPITGITLPFISYGGTSLLINMMAIGIAMSVRVHQEKPSMFTEGE